MGRLEHLKQSLPQNIKDNDFDGVQFVVLNYGAEKETDEWIKKNFQSEIASGRLKYASFPGPQFFNVGHAKNMAHRLSDGDILCNVDADQFIGKDFAGILSYTFDTADQEYKRIYMRHSRTEMIKNYVDAGEARGKIALKKDDFIRSRGYNEKRPASHGDDGEFAVRLFTRHGLRQKDIPLKRADFIDHDNAARIKNLPDNEKQTMHRYFQDLESKQAKTIDKIIHSARNLSERVSKNLIRKPVNVLGFGCGEVYINFADTPTLLAQNPIKHGCVR